MGRFKNLRKVKRVEIASCIEIITNLNSYSGFVILKKKAMIQYQSGIVNFSIFDRVKFKCFSTDLNKRFRSIRLSLMDKFLKHFISLAGDYRSHEERIHFFPRDEKNVIRLIVTTLRYYY